MKVHHTTAFIAALLAGTSPLAAAEPADTGAAVTAETDSASAETAAEQPTIVVTGQRPEYGAAATSTATRTNTPIRNVPQALTVISESQIEDQQLRSVSEMLYFVPGATPGTGESNRDQFTLRGNNTTADFFIDGLRDDVQYFRDFYNVERVEVLKGPNAMIFGRGGGGGVINRMLKRSSLGEYRQVLGAADGFGGMRFTGDFDQPLGGNLGLRVNAMYENGDSFRRHVDLKRYGINPTLGFLAGPATRIDLSYEFLRDRRTTDRGVPALGGEPVEGFDRTFFGDPDGSFARANVNIGRLGIEHELGSGLTLRNRTLYGDYDKFYQNIYPTGLAGTTVSLGAYNSRADRRNLFSQTDLVWENRLGGIDQTLLVGFELGRQNSRNLRQTGTFAAGGNIAPLSDPTVERSGILYAPSGSDANNRTKASVAAIYVQDQIRFSPMFELVAGLRFDSFNLSVNDQRRGVPTFERRDSLWSPRLGLVFKPQQNLSLYTSYSRSYLPQSGEQFSGLSPTTEQLKPERFDNYEVGAKWEPIDGLLATAALYQLDRANSQAKDINDRIVLTGEQRSRGLELGLERSISARWQISAGYSWQEAKLTQASTAGPKGREVPLVPRHSFSLWNRYEVSDAIGLGLGLVARSKSFASFSNAVKLPGYARLDAAGYYELAPGVEAQVNVENILNADYFPTAHNDHNNAPGAPRTVKAQVRFGF